MKIKSLKKNVILKRNSKIKASAPVCSVVPSRRPGMHADCSPVEKKVIRGPDNTEEALKIHG